MARAHIYRSATDNQGNLLFNAQVTVYEDQFSVPLAQTMWMDGTTTTNSIPNNPYSLTNGIIDFWLDTPQRLCLLIQHPSVPDIVVYVDANPPAGQIVYGLTPIEITNTPTASGQVLMSTAIAGEVAWGAAPSGTGLTPIVTVMNADFSSGDPLGWAFTGANVAARSYVPDVPSGTTYTKSLNFPAPVCQFDTSSFTFTDYGRIFFWAKTTMNTGQSVVISQVDTGSVVTPLLTISNTRGWGFYSIAMNPGTWKIRCVYSGTSANPQGFEMAGLVAQYGGTVPAHNHVGSGSNSVALGTSATAFSNATAVGANASATGTAATALGYGSVAGGTNAVAIGNGATANAAYGVAVGGSAGGSPTNTAWTAIGQNAQATGNESVAIGHNSAASADEGVAIGTGASASALGAVALGQGATAAAADGFALGAGATVGAGHTNSVALGQGASTTASNQAMMGNVNTITALAGSLTANGQVAMGGNASRVGFYGSAGVTKPVVNGSDNGNVVVRSLIQALANMGLVTNNTVQQPAAFNAPVGNIDYFLRTPQTGSLGTADFDFQPYVYAPLAYGGTSPFPASPNWSVTTAHTAVKGSQVGLGPLKNAYHANPSFTLQVQVAATGSLTNGDRFVLVTRHTGATDGSASLAYLVFDYQSSTVSLGVNNGTGDPTTYTVASGNSVSLSTAGGNVFDGAAHTITVTTGYQSVGVKIDNSRTYFFRDTSINLTGTYVGWDTNSAVIGNIFFNALLFNPRVLFDGFNQSISGGSTALGNTDSGTAWTMIAPTGGSTLGQTSGILTLTSTSGTGNHIGAYLPTVVNTMGKTVRAVFTSIPGSGTAGILAHYQDSSNYLLVTATTIIQVLAGTQTTLATHSSAIVANDLITVTLNTGGTLVVQKNTTQVSSVTPGLAIPQNPNVGLYAANAAVLPVDVFTVHDQFTPTVYK